MSMSFRADTPARPLTHAQLDANFEALAKGGDSVTRYGADPTGVADSLAAFEAALAALGENETFVVPDGVFALSGKFTFDRLRSTFDCRGTIVPYGSYSGFLLEFRNTAAGGDPTQINVGQRVDIRSLYVDGLYQSRGIRFEQVYCNTTRSITVTRAYGTAMEIGSYCFENFWHGVSLNLCKNRQVFSTPSDWNSGTSYAVGDRVRYAHAAYNAGTTYAAGALVESSGISYMSRKGGNTGNTPASSPTWWVRVDDSFFECMIAHSNKSPFDATVYTTNNGTAGNRYWKHVLQYEPVLNIEHLGSDGVTDHQYFHGLDIRDCDAKYLMHVDNNGNSRPVYDIEVHGGMIHAMTDGVPELSDGQLSDPVLPRQILLGRTIGCKFFGANSRVAEYDDAVSLCYGLNPPAKTSYALSWNGRMDGEGARSVGVLMGAGQSALTTQAHHISHLFPVFTGANAASFIDPFNKLGYDVATPIRGLNVGRRNTRLRLSGDQSIANDTTGVALSWATEDHNPDGAWVVGSPTRLTPPEDWLAWKIHFGVKFAPAAGGVRSVQILRNGASGFAGNAMQLAPSAGASYGNSFQASSAVIYRQAVGEYFEINPFQNSGGAINVLNDTATWVELERVI